MNAVNYIDAIEQPKEEKSESQFPVLDIYITISFTIEPDINSTDDVFQIGFIAKNKIIFNQIKLPRDENCVIFKDFIVDCSDLSFIDGTCVDSLGMILKLNSLFEQIGSFLDTYENNPRTLVHFFVNGFQGLDDLCSAFICLSDMNRLSNYRDLIFDSLIQEVIDTIIDEAGFPLTPFVSNYNWNFFVDHYTIIEYETFIGFNTSRELESRTDYSADNLRDKQPKEQNCSSNSKPAENVKYNNTDNPTKESSNDENTLSPFWQYWESTKNKDGSLCLHGYVSEEVEETPNPDNPLSIALRRTFDIIDTLKENKAICNFVRIFDYITNIPPFGISILMIVPPLHISHSIVKHATKTVSMDKRIEALRYASNGYWGEYHNIMQQANKKTIENVHNDLTVISFIPGIGTAAAVIDFSLYAIETGYHFLVLKDGIPDELRKNLAWSFIGIIPYGKIAKYSGKSYSGALDVIHAYNKEIKPLLNGRLTKKLNLLKKELSSTKQKLADSTRKMDSLSKDVQVLSKNRNNIDYLECYKKQIAFATEQNKYGLNLFKKQDLLKKIKNQEIIEADLWKSYKEWSKVTKAELNYFYKTMNSLDEGIHIKERFLKEYIEDILLTSLRKGNFSIDDWTEWLIDFVINIQLFMLQKHTKGK